MGVWIAIAIGLFVLGSVMALKPSGVDIRLDALRMTARKLELNPKLVPCPDWIRGRDNEFGRGMLGQYALILEGVKLPESRYTVIEGELRPITDANFDPKMNSLNVELDKEPLSLPESIQPFVKAIYSKANSLVVFWDDSHYVKPSTNPDYTSKCIEPDLLVLKSRMLDWAQKLSTMP